MQRVVVVVVVGGRRICVKWGNQPQKVRDAGALRRGVYCQTGKIAKFMSPLRLSPIHLCNGFGGKDTTVVQNCVFFSCLFVCVRSSFCLHFLKPYFSVIQLEIAYKNSFPVYILCWRRNRCSALFAILLYIYIYIISKPQKPSETKSGSMTVVAKSNIIRVHSIFVRHTMDYGPKFMNVLALFRIFVTRAKRIHLDCVGTASGCFGSCAPSNHR